MNPILSIRKLRQRDEVISQQNEEFQLNNQYFSPYLFITSPDKIKYIGFSTHRDLLVLYTQMAYAFYHEQRIPRRMLLLLNNYYNNFHRGCVQYFLHLTTFKPCNNNPPRQDHQLIILRFSEANCLPNSRKRVSGTPQTVAFSLFHSETHSPHL